MSPTAAVKKLIRAGWTETRIAEAVGSSQPAINRIKRNQGKRGPAWQLANKLVAIARGLPA
jgi:DNA-binding XRE family transcriptional regulator